MIRRFSTFQRNNARHPLISSASRLGHLMQLRAGDPIDGLIQSAQTSTPIHLAPDQFPVTTSIKIDKEVTVTGQGYGSELALNKFSTGPILNITANNVVIENIRFTYTGALVASSLITRPVRCSGDSYSPGILSASTAAAAIVVSGDNVTIRNCWFEGFDNVIYSTGDNTSIKCCYFQGQSDSTKSAIYISGDYANVWQCYVDTTAYGVYLAGGFASVSDNTLRCRETGIFVTRDYNRIHGNYVEGNASGFAMALTHDSDSNTVTGNLALPDKSKGTHFFTTGKGNMYAANIGEVDLE